MAQLNVVTHHAPELTAVTTGSISSVEPNGEIFVQLDNEKLPRQAQILHTGYLDIQLYQPETRVLVQQLVGNLPIVLGVLHDKLPTLSVLADGVKDLSVVADGKRTVIEARHEIELKCGTGSILLKKNGKVIIKGNEVTSRAIGANKIKGGSVSIN